MLLSSLWTGQVAEAMIDPTEGATSQFQGGGGMQHRAIRRPNFGDSSHTLLNYLMSYNKRDQDVEYSRKALESLVKKLKDHRELLENLFDVLETFGAKGADKCIPINRTLDGRLQIATRKGFPHMIYARIFRWPEIGNKCELKAIPSCVFAFELGAPNVQPENGKPPLNEVCVNPWHYNKLEISEEQRRKDEEMTEKLYKGRNPENAGERRRLGNSLTSSDTETSQAAPIVPSQPQEMRELTRVFNDLQTPQSLTYDSSHKHSITDDKPPQKKYSHFQPIGSTSSPPPPSAPATSPPDPPESNPLPTVSLSSLLPSQPPPSSFVPPAIFNRNFPAQAILDSLARAQQSPLNPFLLSSLLPSQTPQPAPLLPQGGFTPEQLEYFRNLLIANPSLASSLSQSPSNP